MSVRKNPSHVIDFLFPAALFFFFAASALSVLLIAANIYRTVAGNSALNHTARTSLAYMGERLRQNDDVGQIYLGTLQGRDAMVIEQEFSGETCRTYIYVHDHKLKELFIRDGVEADAFAGKTITQVEDFSMEELRKGLFRFTCTDEEGREASAIVTVRSSQL